MLASMSVAMCERIKKCHSSSCRPSCTAQPSAFHVERRSSARGRSGPLRLDDTRLSKRKASADRTQGPPWCVRSYFPGAPPFPSMPPRDTTSAQHAIAIKIWRMHEIFRAIVFILSLTGRNLYRLQAPGRLETLLAEGPLLSAAGQGARATACRAATGRSPLESWLLCIHVGAVHSEHRQVCLDECLLPPQACPRPPLATCNHQIVIV